MVLIKLKSLEAELENVESFQSPKLHLEQYLTSPHVAAHMLYTIQMNYNDIQNKNVIDLGCGTGMLSIGSSLVGASYCLGVDIDEEALTVCRQNISESEINNIDLLRMNVLQQHTDRSKLLKSEDSTSLFNLNFDTAIMNPPFGTKNIKNTDLDFVKFGLSVCSGAVYSLHKTSHLKAIQNEFKKLNVKVEPMTQITFDLPRSYKNHRQDSVDISVQMLRFSRRSD